MHHVVWSGALVPAPAPQRVRASAPALPGSRAPPHRARRVPGRAPGIALGLVHPGSSSL
jgi:hypothetical protein